jgi:hypothetical protein
MLRWVVFARFAGEQKKPKRRGASPSLSRRAQAKYDLEEHLPMLLAHVQVCSAVPVRWKSNGSSFLKGSRKIGADIALAAPSEVVHGP